MKRLLALALALPLALALAQGCSSTPPASTKVCTAGNNVFCRCADRSEGTKLCNDQGTGYSTPCRLGENQPCPGGEVIPTEDGGLPPVEGIDTCPGSKISLGDGSKTFSGDTSTARDDYKGDQGACGSGDGAPDDVYQITPTATGKLDIELTPDTGFDGMIYVREAPCGGDSKQLKCGNSAKEGVREVITNLGVVTGKQYYLFVDGAGGGAKGKYVLTFNLKPGPFCGDGVVADGEACDDGSPDANGDGCTSGCTSVDGNPEVANKCNGQPVNLWPGTLAKVSATGSTDPAKLTGATNNWENTGASCDVSASKLNVSEDHIYAVTPHGAGTVTVKVTNATFNAQIVVRTTCATAASQLTGAAGCSNNTSTVPDSETVTFPVAKDKTYYVAVDGILGQKGDYNISFQLQ